MNFSVDEHQEQVTDLKKELENYQKFYEEKFEKEFSFNWIEKFEKGELNKFNSDNLDESQKVEKEKFLKEFNLWGENIPELTNFKKSIMNLIKANDLSSIGNLESEFS